MLLKTQTSEVREEVSSASWIFKTTAVASKAFYRSGLAFLLLYSFYFCLEGRI